MDIIIRAMKDEETFDVRRLGRKTFIGFESLFVPRPKKALVAVFDDKIVGAVLYKFYQIDNKKVGYIDFAFVDPSMHGFGVGNRLFHETTQLLWDEGCDYISALVKDDNVGSWGLFLKNGYKRLSFYQMAKELGLGGALKHYFGTSLFVAVGMEYYLAKRDETIPMSKDNSLTQMIAHLVVSSLLFALIGAIYGYNLVLSLVGMLAILVGIIIFGLVGTRFFKEDWHYRTMDGGFLIHVMVPIIGGILPLVGNWYPKTYRKGSDFKKALGITAMFQWGFLILVGGTSILNLALLPIIDRMYSIATYLLVMFSIPFYPFESFAAGRVFRWNKAVYFIMLILSMVVIFVL